MKGVVYVSESGNTKIMGSEKVDATYASIKHTCPDTCELKDKGCYASISFVGIINRRNERRGKGESALDLARSEAKVIDQCYDGGLVPNGRFLRLHVAGDSKTIAGSKLINSAVGRWQKRGGGKVWNYTHCWSNVHRKHWSNVSVLASIDNINQAEAARKQGYAPALVVDEFKTDKAFTMPGSNVKFIPCPAQTKPGGKQIGCTNCKLCFNANRLYESNMGIAFAAHGGQKNVIKRRLNVIQ